MKYGKHTRVAFFLLLLLPLVQVIFSFTFANKSAAIKTVNKSIHKFSKKKKTSPYALRGRDSLGLLEVPIDPIKNSIHIMYMTSRAQLNACVEEFKS